jgi:uncharacterized protein involved in tolerance to divalent cations
MNEKEVKMVICTFPNMGKARQIGTALVQMQLVACVNLIPGIQSVYRWEGKVEEQEEVMAFFKTSAARYGELEQKVIEMHPYELPELVVVDLAGGLPAYLQWVLSLTQPAGDE